MRKISTEAGDEIMNLAEVWKEEARAKACEIAKQFLASGTDPIFVAKNTGLSLDEVKSIQKTLEN